MEVILLEDVPHLGHIGNLVKVAAGYGRNKLLPEKLAIMASTNNKRRLAHEQRQANFLRIKAEAEAKAQASSLAAVSVTIRRKVGDQDKLFGSVTLQDIQAALAAQGIEVDRRKLVPGGAHQGAGRLSGPGAADGERTRRRHRAGTGRGIR